ncbi:flagellar basal body P-ring formation chaperone FlgA [Candidatus Burkholderia verschuerenii]|uniref:flagellar basal body P-ring formation chaperone FlgA n=1 Tax=Candidatus Burkholderia verschuerenii TaxID=242163 RepID=UPI00067C4F56|nr:flagellar basal body P-ring formation chaperone FlgA [Candidatus Burkholderia verschuerenii]
MSRIASRPSGNITGAKSRGTASFARRAAGVSLLVGLISGAYAQQDGGPIVIPGNAETNPAAAAEMAKALNNSKPASAAPVTSVAPPAVQYSPDATRPSGYRAATQAADAAMRNAALALEARAEAADDSMDDAGGMIVIPGPGQAQAKAPQVAARPQIQPQTAAPASGMMKTSFSPATPAKAVSRDVTPVVVQRDDGASAATKPIAAGTATPVSNAATVAQKRTYAPNVQNAAPAQQGGAAVQQDGESIRAAATAFLQQQAAGLPGKVEITVTPVFPRGLAPCSSLDPFMPTGARVWGRMTVGVRCVGERPWTLYVQARVSVNATYYLAARAIAPGEVLTDADLVTREGDLTAMPQAIITDPTQAVGATALSRIGANLPLRTDMLRASTAVSIGQSVHVVTDGVGFAISADGSVMNNASPGQQVRVKMTGGQIITGIVKDNQTVEVRL